MSEAIRFHDGERYVVGLAKVGTKHIHVCCIDDAGVRVISAPKEEQRYVTPLLRDGKPYSITRLVRKFLAVGRERGITQAAREMLEEATA